MIKLFKADGCWMAEFDDPEVFRLFGTRILPTAFLAAAPAEEVLAEVQKLNPDQIVALK